MDAHSREQQFVCFERTCRQKLYRQKCFKLQDKQDDPMRIDEILEIDSAASSEINCKFTAYLSEGDSEERREPFYCKELGFAMEKLRDGYTIKDLWNVMSSTGK